MEVLPVLMPIVMPMLTLEIPVVFLVDTEMALKEQDMPEAMVVKVDLTDQLEEVHMCYTYKSVLSVMS